MRNQFYRGFRAALFLALFSLLAPHRAGAFDTWQPVSPEDLALKDNPASPGADAMILYRENIVDASKAADDGDANLEYIRLKIFTQEGTKRATVEIPFVKDYMKVSDVMGRTIHPDGTIVKFEGKVLETVVTRQSGLKLLVKTFTLPDAQPGSIIEYRYRRQGQVGYLHDMEWIISQDLFTREGHFTFKPYQGPSAYNAFYRGYHLPSDAEMKVQTNGSYTMAVHNIAPVVDEILMPSMESVQITVEFFYREGVGDTPAKFWAGQVKKWNGEVDHFIDKKDILRAEVSKAVAAADSPETKLEKLYARAQQIRNLDEEDSKTAQELKTANIKPNGNVADMIGRGYGHDQEINWLFVGLVRAAGFRAEEVRIAPAFGQDFNPGAEDVSQLSDDIVWVSAADKEYFADPAARYYPFGVLPWYEQSALGLRLDNPNMVVQTSHATEAEATITRNADIVVAANGAVNGKLSFDFTGQEAALIRERNRLEDEEGKKKDLQEEITAWLPSGSKLTVNATGPWDDNTKPLHAEATVEITGVGAMTGSRLAVPVEIFSTRHADAFASQKRINRIDFHYPYQEVDDIKVTPPPGYSVGSLPPAADISAGAVLYSLVATRQPSGVEAKRSFAMKGTIFEPKYYDAIRNIFGEVKVNDAAQVLLQADATSKNN